MRILVTGGLGYIGSHTCVELLNNGYEVIVLDNLSNSRRDVERRIELIAGKGITFVEGDIRDRKTLDIIFGKHDIDAVIHFAGLKAVGESVAQPLKYYDWNVSGSVCLFEAMSAHCVKTLVFSSSATVYGNPQSVPIVENFPLLATNPYGRSKLMIEEILRDLAKSDSEWRVALLRYFNPVGAHESGLIGEDPSGIPNNLMPFVTQVACGIRQELSVFGADYPTPDGTGIRDYIHVMDLAEGHVKALEKLPRITGTVAYNLGTGEGTSVLELIKAFEDANSLIIKYRIVDRRPGDVSTCFADPKFAESQLTWKAARGVKQMCRDAWNFQKNYSNLTGD
jgi:UDP-glucose 4-epimerase